VTAGLVAAGIVLVVVIVLVVRWRSGTGEQQALRHYQNALDTLRTVSARLESTRPPEVPRERIDTERARGLREIASRATLSSSKVAPTRRPDRAGRPVSAGEPASRVEPDSPVGSAVPDRSGPEPALVFDDDSVSGPNGHASASPPQIPARATRIALQRSSKPPSRIPAILGLLLFAVLVVVGTVLLVDKTPHTTSPAAHTHTTAPPRHQTTTTVARTTSSSVPPTTAPPSLQPEQASATPQGATYLAPDAPYGLTLTSSGACWVYATETSTGSVLYTGVLESGQVQNLDATGQVTIKLGHANSLAVTLNGLPVDYPSQYQAVFTMQFVPSAT
jgi:RodZ C-terminal domain